MRCNECNVDLGEEYRKCPLCGADAVDDEPHLKGIKTAQYPKYDKALLKEKAKYKTTFPQKYVFRICTGICVSLTVLSRIFLVTSQSLGVLYGLTWEYIVPALMTFSSLFYFCYAFKEKGRLLHSAISLLATIVTLAVYTDIATMVYSVVETMLIALAISIALFVVLFICKPLRVKEQLKATFKL